jgi:hypothetical protein
MSRAELVVILNDWGFWQSRGTKPAEAIPILQRVVELAPTRAVAWRNLGDAARASLSGAIANPERKRLTQLAIGAYATYRRLTGHDEPEMTDFIEFNALNAPQDEVCRFVAAYYSRGRQQEIAGVANPVDVDGSGRKLNLEVGFAGSPTTPYVRVTGRYGEVLEPAAAFGPLRPFHDGSWESAPAFGLGEGNAGRMDKIVLIPFGGAVYAVTETGGEPVALNNWSGHRVCELTAHDTASIRQSADGAVCNRLLAGSLTSVPPTTRLLDPKPIEDFWSAGMAPRITSISDTDLSGSGRIDHFGSFVGYNPHGECRKAGVVLLDGERPESSARNSALLAFEDLLQDCGKVRAFVVRDHDRRYVEIDSRLLRHNEIASRTLLRVTETAVETICRIVEHPTYSGGATR